MAAPAVNAAALPPEGQLLAFARAAAHLLIEQAPRLAGTRVIARRAGVGVQHLDHREYLPGDDTRHIDWRLSARLQRPMLRRFEAETVTDWTLVLDASSSMAAAGGAKWRGAVVAAAAMAYALLQLGHRVGLLAVGATVLALCPRGRGQAHYASIARSLVQWQPPTDGERCELAAAARAVHGATSVFVLSDFLGDAAMRAALGSLRGHCSVLHALQLSDSADVDLPGDEEVELRDVETGASLPLRTGAAARAHAAATREASTAKLRRYCARHGIAYTDWDLTRSWQHSLIGHLARARANC